MENDFRGNEVVCSSFHVIQGVFWKGLCTKRRRAQHEDFPGGHQTHSHPSTLTCRVLMEFGASVMVWSRPYIMHGICIKCHRLLAIILVRNQISLLRHYHLEVLVKIIYNSSTSKCSEVKIFDDCFLSVTKIHPQHFHSKVLSKDESLLTVPNHRHQQFHLKVLPNVRH